MDEEQGVRLLSEFAQYLDEQIVQPAVRHVSSALERSTPPEPKHPWEMFGEYLRDAAVLILIFVPIDLLIPKAINSQQPIQPKWLAVTLALSLLMLIGGMLAEGRKP